MFLKVTLPVIANIDWRILPWFSYLHTHGTQVDQTFTKDECTCVFKLEEKYKTLFDIQWPDVVEYAESVAKLPKVSILYD